MEYFKYFDTFVALKRPKIVKDIKFYTKTIQVEDDIHAFKTLAFLYSAWRVAVGEVKNPLSEKFLLLLAIYLKYGYNNDSRNKAAEIMGIKTSSVVNMNHDLKAFDYLIDDKYNGRNKFLSKSLLNIKDNYETCIKNGKPMLFILKLADK